MTIFAKPMPMLETAMARPRFRTNHRAIMTLITMYPSKASPIVTKVQRTRTNCQKTSTWLRMK